MKTVYTPAISKRILIVDDDAMVASVYKRKFESERYRVEVVSTGERALQLLETEPFDLVLLDFSLPGMNGAEVLKTIRSQPGAEALPVIVFTNFYLPGVVQAASEAGATRCVRKSNYTPRDMLMVVRELLATGHAFSGNAKPGAVPARIEPMSDFETEYQAKLIADFLASAPQRLGRMRLSHHALVNSEREDVRSAELGEMRRQARLLAGAAGIAGFREIAQLTHALEALFIRLSAKPANTTPSVIRTIGQAVDLLGVVFDHGGKPELEVSVSPSILVVDDEIISREAICSAIEKADLRAVSVVNPMVAHGLLEKTPFDLIFLDVEMPGQSGLDLCASIRKMPTNHATPVVFVTAHSDFENRAQSVLSGGNDFIAKPFLPVELVLKALIWLIKGKVRRISTADHKKIDQPEELKAANAHTERACANDKHQPDAELVRKS
jgi:CheY-like chemotaxis protein